MSDLVYWYILMNTRRYSMLKAKEKILKTFIFALTQIIIIF